MIFVFRKHVHEKRVLSSTVKYACPAYISVWRRYSLSSLPAVFALNTSLSSQRLPARYRQRSHVNVNGKSFTRSWRNFFQLCRYPHVDFSYFIAFDIKCYTTWNYIHIYVSPIFICWVLVSLEVKIKCEENELRMYVSYLKTSLKI